MVARRVRESCPPHPRKHCPRLQGSIAARPTLPAAVKRCLVPCISQWPSKEKGQPPAEGSGVATPGLPPAAQRHVSVGWHRGGCPGGHWEPAGPWLGWGWF